MGFRRVVAGFGAFGGSMYALMESFAIYGGNIKSTLAGEFAFSWALAFGLFYLGVVIKATGNRNRSARCRPCCWRSPRCRTS